MVEVMTEQMQFIDGILQMIGMILERMQRY